MFRRHLSEIINETESSFLLLGPRQVGKSTLLRSLQPDLSINLMDEVEFATFTRNHAELSQRLAARRPATVFIDEIQRIPSLLNTIQALMDGEWRSTRFYITGSSAAKLKRGQANLLPGRVYTFQMGPLVAGEYGDDVPLGQLLSYGSLPAVLVDERESHRQLLLRSYAGTYLKEEIQAEALTRNIEGFSRFIHVVASWSGRHIDLSKVAGESEVPRATATRYLEILTDTMIVHVMDPFVKPGNTTRLVKHPKFFWFDVGALNGLMENFTVSLDRVGPIFETFVLSQIRHMASSRNAPCKIHSWRTATGAEVDAVIQVGQDVWGLECKASTNVGESDAKGLLRFREWYGRDCRLVICYMGHQERKIGDVWVLPYRQALRSLFGA